jgi:hypothetical protein
MTQDESTEPLKNIKVCYEPPSNVSEKANYYKGRALDMKDDTHFADVETDLDDALVLIGKLMTAIITAQSRKAGTVAARNVLDDQVCKKMDEFLPIAQKVVDGDPVNAITFITSLGLSYRKRQPVTKKDIEIRHGEVSGSFDLLVKKPKGNFAVVWVITTTPDDNKSWRLADFSQNTHGFIEDLDPGTIYYFKARVSSSVTGKSDWTGVVKKICN